MTGADATRHAFKSRFKPRAKYRAVRTNGYASKLEARYAAELEMRKRALNGDVADWLEQVPVRFACGTKYVIDFMLVHRDGMVTFVEVKGAETAAWKIKMRMLENERPEIFNRLVVVS